MGSVLKVRDLRHRRGRRDVLAIDELDLGEGDRLAVLGSNGAGKTTLLRLLAGLEAPTSGTVEVDGLPTTDADLSVRRQIGYATQRAGLLSTSVIRNVELPLRWRGIDRATRRSTALAALQRVNAANLAERRALSLSGGEAQRVSLARTLALEPQLLLLDEPAAGLDAEARETFFDDLEAALAERTTTVVHVSHRADEALRLADQVAILAEGAVRQLGEPASVVQRPVDATVAKLVGYDNVLTVEVDALGQVLIGGAPSGLTAAGGPGSTTLAAWAAAIRITPPDAGPLRATVERVSPGQGCWDVILAAGEKLHARLGLDQQPPRLGESVTLRIDPAHATVLPGRVSRREDRSPN